MKLSALMAQCAKLIEECPEAADMEVYNTSCLDTPLRFATSGVYIGNVVVDMDTGECYASRSAASDCGVEDDMEEDIIVIEAM